MHGGEDLEGLYLAGIINAANPSPVPVLLGDTGVTSFNFSLAGGNNVLTNILGMQGTLVRRGEMEMTGEIGWYVADDPMLTEIERFGSPDFNLKAAMHILFRDPDGFRKILTNGRVTFAQSGGEGGGDGEEAGTMAFGSEAKNDIVRTCALQQFSPFV